MLPSGFDELLAVAVIAFVILGPRRTINLMYWAGRLLQKGKNFAARCRRELYVQELSDARRAVLSKVRQRLDESAAPTPGAAPKAPRAKTEGRGAPGDKLEELSDEVARLQLELRRVQKLQLVHRRHYGRSR